MIYSFLPRKTEESYLRFFRWLSEFFTPVSCSVDFEQAIISAVTTTWPQCRMHGCYFHFTQNLWKNIQTKVKTPIPSKIKFFNDEIHQLSSNFQGFASEYNNNDDVKMFFRYWAVLAFVPIEDVLKAVDYLLGKYPAMCNKYKPFVDYFICTYVGKKKVGRGVGRHPSLYERSFWNVHRRTIDGQPRTSNNVEGWHNGVTYSIITGQKFNHILIIIDGLKLEQQNTEHVITRLNTGTKENRRRTAYVDLDRRITTVLEEYKVESLDNFFSNLALIISY